MMGYVRLSYRNNSAVKFFVVVGLCPISFASSKGIAPSVFVSSPFIVAFIIVTNFSELFY